MGPLISRPIERASRVFGSTITNANCLSGLFDRVKRACRPLLSITAGFIMINALVGSPAKADVRDFPFTYEWYQNYKGERELAYHLEYLRNGDDFKHEIEFEYGLTRRFSIAPYIVFKHGDGRSLHYDAVKLE